MAEWLDQIPDQTLVARLKEWLEANGKKDLTSIRLPIDVVTETGIPKEILSVAQIREVVKMIMNPFYIVASVLGLNMVNSKVSYLYSDDYYDLREEMSEEEVEESDE